jgi:holo-[acyl-carrier protein] synthase
MKKTAPPRLFFIVQEVRPDAMNRDSCRIIYLIAPFTAKNSELASRLEQEIESSCIQAACVQELPPGALAAHGGADRGADGPEGRLHSAGSALYLIDAEEERPDSRRLALIKAALPEGSLVAFYNAKSRCRPTARASTVYGLFHAQDSPDAIIAGLRAITAGTPIISPYILIEQQVLPGPVGYTLGCDIVVNSRITRLIDRAGDRFLRRFWTAGEISYCQSKALPGLHFAGTFAAKEAVFKALGLQWSAPFSWKEIEIIHASSGAPRLNLAPRLIELLHDGMSPHVVISISLCRDYAMATALAVRTRS